MRLSDGAPVEVGGAPASPHHNLVLKLWSGGRSEPLHDLKAVLDGLDSVIVYRVDGPATLTREVWGHEYGNIDSIL